MKIFNLNESASSIQRKNEVKALATAAPLGDSSITKPGKRLRIGAPGSGGYLRADGTIDWEGLVHFVGQFLNEGPFENRGPFTNTGPLEQNGDAELNGDTTIQGQTVLMSELILDAAARIYMQGTVPVEMKNGVFSFANGGEIRGASTGVQIAANNAMMTAFNNIVALQVGSKIIALTNAGVTITADVGILGELTAQIPLSSASGLQTVKVDPVTGKFFRTV